MSLRKATTTIQNEQNLTAQDIIDIKTTLFLQNVNNTSDFDKPISAAQQNALDEKQEILSEGPFVDGDKTKLDQQSGVNTGDQDISGIATNANAINDLENNKQDILAEGAFVDGDKTKLDRMKPIISSNNTSTFELNTSGGNFANDVTNGAINYSITIGTNALAGAYIKVRINAATEPTVNGVTTGKILGATFQPNTDMDMVIYTEDLTTINYYFLER